MIWISPRAYKIFVEAAKQAYMKPKDCQSKEDGVCRLPIGTCEQCDQFDARQIKPYVYERSLVNGFDFYKYLHIRGGSSNWKGKGEKYRNGGEFDFIVYYAMPEEMKDKPSEMCERIWCIEKKIVYGEGKTIEEAYRDYSIKVEAKERAAHTMTLKDVGTKK